MTKNLLADRLNKMVPSATVEMNSLALKLKAEGKEVISLAAGEPDFNTPDHIKIAAKSAIDSNQTRYTSVDGTAALKKAIIKKFKNENGLTYELSQITVGAGGKQVISNALIATLSEGDEVIVPAPYWVSYPDLVSMFGGTPVFVKTSVDNQYKMLPEELVKAITPKTKWLILNSPSNPTGAVYSENELRGLADVLLKHPQVYIMSDDIYEHIVYDNIQFKTLPQLEPRLYDRTLIVNGVSKAYNMTGWRIGYGAGPAQLIKAMAGVQGQLTSNPCSISQAAAVAALEGPQEFIADQRDVFQQRRDMVVDALNAINGLSCPKPQGAFYVYPSCADIIGAETPQGKTLKDDKDVVAYLLESEGIALVHGQAFGLSPCFRISYAASTDVLEMACKKISKAIGALKLTSQKE